MFDENGQGKDINFKAPVPERPAEGPEERETSEINFEMYEQSLGDGTADGYFEEVGALPAESLLEEQGDERVWSDLTTAEQTKIFELLSKYASEHGYRVERDDEACIVFPE